MHRLTLRASAALCAFTLPLGAGAATFTVTNVNDSGAGSLRAALQAANTNAGFDTIVFNIAGIGEKVIAPLTQLPSPSAAAAVFIDGFSQPGFTTAPLIRLDGVNLPENASGLTINAPNSTVRGLKFTRFGSGIAIYADNASIYGCYFGTDGTVALANGSGIRLLADTAVIGGTAATSRNVFSGNDTGIYLDPGFSGTTIVNTYFGLNPAGTQALPNTYAAIRSFADSLTIGGPLATQRNVISGNDRYGISIDGGQYANIVNNYIGTDATGTTAVPNETGISVSGGSSHAVGGSAGGDGNLISGNSDTGVFVGDAAFVTIAGNRIGTNLAGTAALPNGQYGIQVHGDDVTIGGFPAAALNVISGNGRDGIGTSQSAERVFILNNRIGTNVAGTASVPNAEHGIWASGTDITIGLSMNLISGNGGGGIGASNVDGLEILNNRIGTNLAGMSALANGGYGIRVVSGSGVRIGGPNFGNQVSGNERGISLESDAGAIVQSNNFGLNADETAALGNGDGIDLSSSNNLFGGTGAGQGNVVAGNDGGVTIGAGGAHNVIQGNFLGINRTGTFVPGNGYASMYIYEGFDTLVGGTQPGAGNVIAGNYASGIFQRVGKRNSFLGNSIFANELGGIDSEPVGPSPNDPLDIDQGPNENQNRPVLRSAIASNNQIALVGELHSAPGLGYRVEFFHNPTCHESGLGEGRTFLGAADVVTQADGNAAIVASLASNLSSGFVTATATAPDGNTSEFSPCIAMGVPGNGKFTFWRDPGLSYEDHGKVTISVIRSEGLEGTVTVAFATAPDSATAPADYTHTTQLLTFGPGEWLRTVTVPLKLDNEVEGDEEFKVTLSNPTGGATIATPQGTYILFDHELAYPFLVVSNLSLDEPASGQVMATFDVSLSSTDHTVVVDYETVAETATAGLDFQAKTGTLTFPVSATTTTLQVSVPVYADLADENDETFRLDIHGNNGTYIASETVGEAIIRDDSAPIGSIFADSFE